MELNQTKLADELAQELVDCGHEEISGWHILDAMASCGIKLVPDFSGDSSNAALLALYKD